MLKTSVCLESNDFLRVQCRQLKPKILKMNEKTLVLMIDNIFLVINVNKTYTLDWCHSVLRIHIARQTMETTKYLEIFFLFISRFF